MSALKWHLRKFKEGKMKIMSVSIAVLFEAEA
jgi:hypothetical protein